MKKGFPKEVYVSVETPRSDDPYFIMSEALEEINEDAGNVAIYTLKEIKKLKVVRTLTKELE